MLDLEDEVIGCLILHPENIGKLVIPDDCFKNQDNRQKFNRARLRRLYKRLSKTARKRGL